MAVEAAAVVVARMPRVACVTGILPVILRVCVARAAGDARVPARLDVEPCGAVGVGPRVLHVAFLANRSRAVRGVLESGASVVFLVAARAARRSRHDPERLQIPVAVAALEGAMRAHEREPRHVVIEPCDVPGRRPVAFVAVPAERPLVIVRVAARAVLVGVQEFLALVAFDAGHVLMEREKILRGMLEFDEREGNPGRVAALAFLPEVRIVRRVVAAAAIRRGLFVSMTGFAGHVRVMPEEREARVGMFRDKGRLRGVGVLSPDRRAELHRLGVTGFQNEVQGEKRRHEDEDEYRRSILSHERPAQSPQSPPDQRSPWQLKQEGCPLSPPRRFCPWHRTQLSNGLQ